MGGVEDDRTQVIKDYFHDDQTWRLDQAMEALAELSTDELLDLKTVAAVLHLPVETGDLDSSASPRGYRLLSKIPRLPDVVIDRIAEHFGSLHKIMRATAEDLDDVDGVGNTRAKAIKEGLSRLAETSILDRYS